MLQCLSKGVTITTPDLSDEIIQDSLRHELEVLLLGSSEDWRLDFIKSNSHDRITDRIYCGGDDYLYDHRAFNALIAEGITHVLDCRIEARSDNFYEDASVIQRRKKAFTYLNNGIDDDFKPKSVDHFRKSIDFATNALNDPSAKIYAHCAAGINRGPSSCYAILRTAGGLGRVEAELLLRKQRPVVRIAYLEDAERAIKALGLGGAR